MGSNCAGMFIRTWNNFWQLLYVKIPKLFFSLYPNIQVWRRRVGPTHHIRLTSHPHIFLWFYIKSKVYKNNLTILKQLKSYIKNIVKPISVSVSSIVMQSILTEHKNVWTWRETLELKSLLKPIMK